jgi:predicted nuclease with RNAse H fold
MVILGVDLRASSKRASTVVALNGQSCVKFVDSFHDDSELVQMADCHRPELIAIGAPLGLPSGLCCLETSCKCCFSVPQRKGRQSELELSRMGISCFFTSKGSIIRNLIYRSMALSRLLSGLGLEVIEAYPHATKVILFGDKVPPKNSAESLVFMKERLTPLIQGLDPHLDGLDRNTCDAMLNAYTGLLHTQDATDTLGAPEEGMVVLPMLPR